MSRKVILSRGGNVSQSSRKEWLLRKDELCVRRLGLGGYDGRRAGVIGSRCPSSVSEPIAPKEGDVSPALISGVFGVLALCIGMGMESDMLGS